MGFRNLVDFFVGFGREVKMQLDDGGGLALWSGPHVVAEYPRRRAPEGVIKLVLDTELLSMALECVQSKDRMTLEWSGRDTVCIQLTQPSGQSTDIDFPVTRVTDEKPPRVVCVPCTERRISSSAFSIIVHRFAETAVCAQTRIAFFKDGIEFKTEGDARFKMRSWHPTNPCDGSRSIVVPTPVLARVSMMRAVNSVMSLGIYTETSAVVTSKGRDGCVVCVTILVGEDDPELGNAAQPGQTRV